jgi:hypothetical protein
VNPDACQCHMSSVSLPHDHESLCLSPGSVSCFCLVCSVCVCVCLGLVLVQCCLLPGWLRKGGEDWLAQCCNVVAWGNGCWSYSWQVGKVVAVHWGNRVGFGGALRSSQLREGVLHQHSVTEPRMLNVKCAGSSPQEKGCGLVAA